jgi:enamine deaminase RidA (YjgF/YER057c/UK114 family)
LIKPEGASKSIAPYSPGFVVNKEANIVFLSGSLGIDPKVIPYSLLNQKDI